MSKSLSSKINKNDVELALTQKSDISEVNKMGVELKSLIQKKASNEQVNQLLSDKISKNELLFYLSNKPSIEDIQNMLEEKIDLTEFDELIKQLEIIKSEKLSINIFDSEIKEIRQLIDNKSNSIDVINALDTKADKEELKNSIQNKIDKKEIQTLLNEKVNKNEIDKINRILNNKINKNELQKFDNLNNLLKGKADNSDFNVINDAFQDMKINLTKRIDNIDSDLDRLIDNIKSQFKSVSEVMDKLEKNKVDNSIIDEINMIVNNKVDNEIVEESLAQLKENIYSSINNFTSELELNRKKFEEKILINLETVSKENQSILENINIQNLANKDLFESKISNNYNQDEINEILNKIKVENNSQINYLKLDLQKDMEKLINVMEEKIDSNTLNNCLLKIENEINAKLDSQELNEIKDKIISEINDKIKVLYEDMNKELSNKISKKDLQLLLEDKIDNQYEEKLSKKDFQGFKIYLEEIKKELKQKIDLSIFNKIVNQFNINFDNIKNDMNSKVNSKEINKILQNTVNNEKLNKMYNEINNKLNEKTNNNDFTTAIDNQAIINDTLCNENCIGRWVWKSGKIKSSYTVPWESQSINTSPDNFIWEKDKTFIMINEDGLYELNFGFYSDKKPNVQIIVNGEIIINSQNNNNLNKNISMSNKKNGGLNYGGSITGLSLIEFIMLPKQSKLSVCYNGGNGMGFIGLKKL